METMKRFIMMTRMVRLDSFEHFFTVGDTTHHKKKKKVCKNDLHISHITWLNGNAINFENISYVFGNPAYVLLQIALLTI